MSQWYRVSRARKCSVCGKPDWCTFADDVACCMRIQSDRPAANGGWMHSLDGKPLRPAPRTPKTEPPRFDAPLLLSRWQRETGQHELARLAGELGIPLNALTALGPAWALEHQAWAFGMEDGLGNTIGIRLRAADGRKWAVTGSRQGIFVSRTMPQDLALVCEGPTDTLTALAMGFYAVGRPSAPGGGLQIRALLQRLGIWQFVMVADHDAVGMAGARRVAKEIGMTHKTIMPPAKDLREAYTAGLTPSLLRSQIDDAKWT